MYFSFKLQFVAAAAILSTVVSGVPLAAEVLEPESGMLVARADSQSYTNFAEFRRVMIAAHNFFRDQHGVGPVTWNTQRAADANTYANKCVFQHSGAKGAGENIAIGYGDAAQVVSAWTSGERPSYNYNKPGFSAATGHFTQVVWKKSTTIGCGRAKCSGGWLVVCQYVPQGNVLPASNFAANVPRQIKGTPSQGYAYKPFYKRDAAPEPQSEAEIVAAAEAEADDGEVAQLAPILVNNQ